MFILKTSGILVFAVRVYFTCINHKPVLTKKYEDCDKLYTPVNDGSHDLNSHHRLIIIELNKNFLMLI